jgi:RNA polymerase primary sigma factor
MRASTVELLPAAIDSTRVRSLPRITATQTLAHAELDRHLDRLARSPARFRERARKFATRLEQQHVDLELTPPETWKSSPSAQGKTTRVSIENQLRVEIERIRHLDRDEEVHLARRIEFAGIRLDLALSEAGLSRSALVGVAPGPSRLGLRDAAVEGGLPAGLRRRACELHALRTEMVERNLYLVLINAARCVHKTVGRGDLIQEGAVVLFRAVDGFDWRRGLLFRTYAVHWLNQAFYNYMYNFGHTVRLPVYLQKATKHIRLAVERLGDSGASIATIAREAGVGESVVASALAAERSTRSFDTPCGDLEDGRGFGDMLTLQAKDGTYLPEVADVTVEASLVEAFERLSERERLVACMRFGIGGRRTHTLAEVAAELGVSIERVRQIQLRGMTKMRTPQLQRRVEDLLK